MRIQLFTFLSLLTLASIAQPGWNWPENAELYSLAKEKQAYYKICMQLDNYDEALFTLSWLYTNNPKLNNSIYIEGVKVIEKILEKEQQVDRRKRLEDSLLWMFDQRALYFNEKAVAMDRKAYSAFKMYYKIPAKYPYLSELFSQALELNGSAFSSFNIVPYMTLAKAYYQSKPGEFTAENLLDVHSRLTEIIDVNRKGMDSDKYAREQDKIDAFLASVEGVLTCEFIGSKLAPKLRQNPDDIGQAKKIFSYSLKAKCTDEPYFVEAGEKVFASQPSFALANALGSKYLASQDYNKASQFLLSAQSLATSPEEKYEVAMSLAQVASKEGTKQKARQLAYEALSYQPGDKAAYNLIGNLYFTSFENCKKETSKVEDRLVFLAAYEKYKLAGNTEQMAAARSQFPSMEELFNEGKELGQTMTCGCWINEQVKLDRRD